MNYFNTSKEKKYRFKHYKKLRIMKLSFILCFLCMLQAYATSYSQTATISLSMNNVKIEKVLDKIEEQSEFVFLYNQELVDLTKNISIDVSDKNISEVLNILFGAENIDFTVQDRQIILSPTGMTGASKLSPLQQITITGTVIDSEGLPLPGVGVLIKGTSQGTATNANGTYSLSVQNENAILVFSYIGFISQETTVGSRRTVNITLIEDVQQMEEVVVIGYGTVARKDVTTAVSVVSTKDLDERPITDAVQAIQGKAAGVHVYMPSGTPGAEMVIRVRGTTSMTGSNEPLYVVDGVPVSNISFLSPQDIASMQVLKDASSAAIYGSRAANGVVLITTRQAGDGAKVRASMQYGMTNLSNRIEPLNAMQYKELIEELDPVRAASVSNIDVTDWYNETYTTGNTQNYQLQVSDGNQKLRYFVSGGYTDEKGIIRTTYSKRYNFRANLESQVRSWLKFGANLNYSERKSNGITTGQPAGRGGLVLSTICLPTSIPVKNEEGYYTKGFYGEVMTNVAEALDNNKYRNDRSGRLIATGNSTITFMPGLDLNTMFTMDRINRINTNFTPPRHASDRDEWGSASDERAQTTVFTFDNVLTYKKIFGNHNIEAMAGSSWTESTLTYSSITGTHFRDLWDEDRLNYTGIQTLNVANQIGLNGATSNGSQWAIMSYFGRLSYNFNSKYLFTANIRSDGSSRLHPDHRWGYFPSVSAAWRISSEEFMKDFTWLDDMKIRANWGKTGNQSGINDYAYLQRYGATRQEWWVTGRENSLVSISQSNIRNSQLTWETTTQTGVGLDLMLLNNRLSVTADLYYKYTTDMLLNVSLPSGAAAASSIVRNEGEMSNRGWEFSINSRNFTGDGFQWNTEFNISGNKNKLEKLELQQVYHEGATEGVFYEINIVRNTPGRALSGFYGYISDGVDPQTGDMIYRDLNGDGKRTATDKTYIGDPNPTFIFGLTNTFTYKGFNLSIFLQGSVGNDIFNISKTELVGMFDCRNQSTDVLRRWRAPGDVTDIPRAKWDIHPSTYFIEDGSYLRVKDVTLSYNFKGAFLNKLGVSRLQPYFTGRNLLTLTNYSGMDPEVNQQGGRGAIQGIDYATYPHYKQFVFGINLEF